MRAPSCLRVAVATEQRLVIVNGTAWAPPSFGHDYWASFLGVATHTTLIARSEPAAKVPAGFAPVEGPNVRALLLPPLRVRAAVVPEMATSLVRLARLDRRAALVLRMPGMVASLTLLVALIRRQPFAVQLVGDPIDVTFVAGVAGRIGRVAGALMAASVAVACRKAAVVSYVTGSYLQRRYPPGRRSKAHAVSDVRLPEHLPRHDPGQPTEDIRITTVASMEQVYKRVDLLVDAVAILREEGWPIRLAVVGAGALTAGYEDRAGDRGIGTATTFHGTLPRTDVLELVASSHLFVLCSDTEGMPRSMIEAMATGTPCIGSAVGGTTELLPPYALFARGSLIGLVAALRRHLVSPALRRRSSEEMVARAAPFAATALSREQERFAEDVIAALAVHL